MARIAALSERVQAARVAAGLTPPALATVVAYSDDTPDQIAAMERQHAGSPLIVVVHKLCRRPVASAEAVAP